MTLSHSPQAAPDPAPDIVFFRNTGIALVTLALLAGSISLAGSLKADQPPMPIRPAGDLAQSAESVLRQTERDVSRREVFQAEYINPESDMQ